MMFAFLLAICTVNPIFISNFTFLFQISLGRINKTGAMRGTACAMIIQLRGYPFKK
jgi:hypothetical protein